MLNNSEYAYCGGLTEEWRDPPPPFNPEARPYAGKLAVDTTEAMKAEGWYENFTLKERQATNSAGVNLWQQMYDLLKIPYEKQFQKNLNNC